MTNGLSARPTDNTLYAFKMPGAPDMQRPYRIRATMPATLLALALLLGPALLQAQYMGRQRGSALPPTPPTPPAAAPVSAPAPAPQVTQPPPAPTPATTPASRANVTYANGLLSVAATNSSLNQILREISRQTGMKITGGVTDERVFGNYGPASPATILAALLDGTGSNMLLVQSNGSRTGEAFSSAAPAELVLTPRHGGPTPPNPNARGFDDGADSADPDGRRAPQTISNRPPPPPPPSAPVPAPQAPSTNNAVGSPIGNPIGTPIGTPINPTTPPATPPATPADPTAPTTQDQSPNGVKTPQQIYDQLLKLRQQQQPPSN